MAAAVQFAARCALVAAFYVACNVTAGAILEALA